MAERTEQQREASRIATRKWRATNPEKCREADKRHYHKNRDVRRAKFRKWYASTDYYIKRNYGMTKEQFTQLLADQDGVCAVCRRKPKKFTVDHCHTSGRVRGLLCYSCNSALGMFKDSPELIQAAKDYLRKAMQ